jgi:hypothetical protein
MGFFDRAKQLLGLRDEGPEPAETGAAKAHPPARGAARPAPPPPSRGLSRGARSLRDRPELQEPPPAQRALDEALAARDAGDREGARRILAEIDRGGGLRTVLRAAAALEAGDEKELGTLLGAVRSEAEGWRLLLQLSAALGNSASAAPYLERAAREKAPAWALGWTRTAFADETERRKGLVELLFADAPLARLVAARELGVGEAGQDADAAGRYAAFTHGRDCIRRFGALAVAALLDRVIGRAG